METDPVEGTDGAVHRVRLRDADGKALEVLSQESGIGLSLDEMKRVQAHFQELGRDPTDIELESLGQAWSEHCCYKSSKPHLREHVFGAAEERVLLRQDAGVLAFDEDHCYVVKIESHNHPSAIEPYGGAATGIGGVIRDVLCMGARPIALVDPLFFAPLDTPEEALPEGTKHPRYLFDGVVAGIRDYGNRVGIPTVAGQVCFHPGYLTNPIVNVGCVGIAKRDHVIESKVGGAGDVFVLIGGRTGRDGIHGVTFASAELTADSEETSLTAVQLGDPVTKEPLIHVCLQALDRGLLTGLKDLGGGGLSCVVGEMALEAGLGAEVDLETVPLKEPGLKPWEIWVSESQERMMLSVRPDDLDEVLGLCALWDVEATVVGRAVEGRRTRVRWHGQVVFDMDTAFLTGGPEYARPFTIPDEPDGTEPDYAEPKDHGDVLLAVLADPDVCSKEWVVRQYDHIVQGRTVLQPLQGQVGQECHGDAALLKPLPDSFRGLAIACDVDPHYTVLDPYHGTKAAVDEVCRKLVSVGARPDSLVDCLNFGNPERPDRLGAFADSTRALGEMCRALDLPLASGNVSLYNEGPQGPIPPTPTLMGVGIVEDVRRCVTADLKAAGDPLYLVGRNPINLGGSVYHRVRGVGAGLVPTGDADRLARATDALLAAMEQGLVRACHDVGAGGLGAALAEMAMGGNVGADVDLQYVAMEERPDHKLFSEAGTRWVVEVPAGKGRAFEALLMDHGVGHCTLGETGGPALTVRHVGHELLSLDLDAMRDAWRRTIPDLMGGGA